VINFTSQPLCPRKEPGIHSKRNWMAHRAGLEVMAGRQAGRPQRPLGRVEVSLYSAFDLGTRRGWGVSVTPRPYLIPGKDPVPIVQESGWISGPVWTGAENLTSTRTRSPDRPARRQSLYRLRCPAGSDGEEKNILPLGEFESRTSQTVATVRNTAFWDATSSSLL
jgi:hypothetical protein